jgi:hypothetical protein
MKWDVRWLVGVVLFVAVFAALSVLRREVTRPVAVRSNVERVEEEGRGDGPSVRRRVVPMARTDFASNANRAAPRPSPRIVRLEGLEKGEGYEAEKLRAFGDGSIYGEVAAPDGRPLAGVSVQLFDGDPMTKNPPLREATTDTSGTYTLEKVNTAERPYVLIARAEGWAPFAGLVMLRGSSLEQNITLRPGVECSGVVVDAVTSLPIVRATVYHPVVGNLVLRPLGTMQTSAMGEFRFSSAPAGSVKLLVECSGYHTTKVSVQTPTTNTVVALVPGGATIRGMTISRLTQKSEGKAKVLAIGEQLISSTISDDEGLFEFQDLPPGRYTLVGIKGMAGLVQRIDLGEREIRENVRLVVPAPIFVSGRVIHAYSRDPLVGVHLYYPSPTGKGTLTTDENGMFAFETLAVDDYWIEVHEKGYLPFFEGRTTGARERIERTIRRTDASDQVTIALRPVSCVEGVVKGTDRNGKAAGPVGGVDVRVAYKQGDIFDEVITRTDALGQFFVNLATGRRGTAKIAVPYRNMFGFASVRVPTRRPAEILLRRDRMNGRLFLSDGTPLAGVEIRSRYPLNSGNKLAQDESVQGASTFVRNNGRFALPLAQKQKVQLVFVLPDGVNVCKDYETKDLLAKGRTFVYDPVARDVVEDTSSKQR